ncbi:methylated-DNA--[protein]-cysteine S-methyltransferase [Myroides sp. LJL116]
MTLLQSIFSSPLGDIVAVSSPKGICYLMFKDHLLLKKDIKELEKRYNAPIVLGVNRHIELLQQELEAYFTGELTRFNTLLDIDSSSLQDLVYDQLLTLEYGQIITYKQQAMLLGKPSSVRPIASANAKNRIMILIPCHRVVGTDGKLTGYAGGLYRKQYLIDLETKAYRLEL